MRALKKKNKKEGYRPIWDVVVFIVLLLAVPLALMFFQSRTVVYSRNSVNKQLLSAAKEQSILASDLLSTRLEYIEAFAAGAAVQIGGDYNADMMSQLLDQSQLSAVFYEMAFVSGDGIARFGDRPAADVSGWEVYRRASAGEASIGSGGSGTDGGFGYGDIVFAVPMGNNVNGYKVLLGFLKEAYFRSSMVSQAFDGEGFSLVCDAAGDIRIGCDGVSGLAAGNNIFEFFRGGTLGGLKSEEELAANLTAGTSGVFTYKISGSSAYAAYYPLGINDWTLFYAAPSRIVEQDIKTAVNNEIRGILAASALCVALLAFVCLRNRAHRRNIEKERERLRQSEEEYRIVVEHSDKLVFSYDIGQKTVVLSPAVAKRLGLKSVLTRVPDSIVQKGWVDADSADVLRKFFADMDEGKPRGTAIIRSAGNGAAAWYELRYSLVFDDSGAPLQGIISLGDISGQHETELAYEKWQLSYRALPSEKTKYYEYNLTRDLFEREEGSLFEEVPENVPKNLTSIILYLSKKYVFAADLPAFLMFFSRGRLFAGYGRGDYTGTFTFRSSGRGSSELWTNVEQQIIKDPFSGDVKCFFLFRDVDPEKREEMLIQARSKIDPLTGIMNRTEFADQMTAVLNDQDFPTQHVLAILDLDNFKRINDMLGHRYGDRVLIDVAKKLNGLLRSGDLVGRLAGDEFVVCMKGIVRDDVIEKRLDIICQSIRREIQQDLMLTCSIGVAVYPRDGGTFDELYEKADTALYQAKDAGRCTFRLYQPNMLCMSAHAETPIDRYEETDKADEERRSQLLTRAEEIFRRQSDDERYRIIMEHSGTMMIEWNLETGDFFRSEGIQAYEIGRVDPRALYELRFGDDCVHPADYAAVMRMYKDRVRTGDNRGEILLRLKKTNGDYQWCRLAVIVLRSGDGSAKRVIITIDPIAFARENPEIKLNALLSYMPGGVLMLEIGDDIRTLYVSPSCFRVLQEYSAEEESCDPFSRVFPEDAGGLRAALNVGAQVGETVDFVYRVRTAGGLRWRHLHASRIPYEKSERPVLVATVIDITEQRHSSSQIEQMLSDATGGIALVSGIEKPALVFFNTGLLRLIGYTRSECEESIAPDFSVLVAPEDRLGLRTEVETAARVQRPMQYIFRSSSLLSGKQIRIMVVGINVSAHRESPVFLLMLTELQAESLRDSALRLNEERFRLAFGHAMLRYWELDIRQRILFDTTTGDGGYLEDAPETLIKNGTVPPEHAEALRSFFQDIYSGAPRAGITVKYQFKPGDYCWARLSCATVFAEGSPQRAIGVTEYLPGLEPDKARFDKEILLLTAMREELLATAVIDLLQGKVMSRWRASDIGAVDTDIAMDAQIMFNYGATQITDENELEEYQNVFSVDNLIGLYERGHDSTTVEYRRSMPEGRTEWIANMVIIRTKPVTGELFAFSIMRSIDARRKRESVLGKLPDREGSMLLYTRNTAETIIRSELHKTFGGFRVMAVIRLLNVNRYRRRIGYSACFENVFVVGRILRSMLDNHAVLCRYDESHLLAFFPSAPSVAWAGSKLAAALEVARNFLADNGGLKEDTMDFAVGITGSGSGDAGYAELVDGAMKDIGEAGT